MNAELSFLRATPHISFSQINVYLNICSLKYAYQYVYDMDPEDEEISGNLILGSVMHQALSLYAKGESLATSTIFFSDALNKAFSGESIMDLTLDDALNKGVAMLAAYSEQWHPAKEEVVSVAESFSVRIPGVDRPLIGEFDMVIKNEKGEKIIVDWKTASRSWPAGKEDMEDQITAYYLAFWEKYKEAPAGARFDVITSAKTPKVQFLNTTRSVDQIQRFIKKIQMMQDAVKAGFFFPAAESSLESWACKSCSYSHACAAWHRDSIPIYS